MYQQHMHAPIIGNYYCGSIDNNTDNLTYLWVHAWNFDNTIVKSYEESNDGEETIYQFGGYNPQIIARIKIVLYYVMKLLVIFVIGLWFQNG